VRAAVLAAALSLVVVSLLTAGCGGDSAAATPLSPTQWRAQTNRICERYGREIERIAQPKTDSDITAFIAGVAPLWKQQAASIRALRPPPALADPAESYAINLEYLAKWLVELHVARQRNDGARAGSALDKVQDSARSAKELAVGLRLRACRSQRVP